MERGARDVAILKRRCVSDNNAAFWHHRLEGKNGFSMPSRNSQNLLDREKLA